MQGYYILNEAGEPEQVFDVVTWARWMEAHRDRKRVAYDTLTSGTRISTVFLGLDHNYSGEGPPVLWETMIFGGPHDDDQWRYTSLEEARQGHRDAVLKAMAAEPSVLDKLPKSGEVAALVRRVLARADGQQEG